MRETRRTDAERLGLMLGALRDARAIVAEGSDGYAAETSMGMLLRRGLKNCAYEYCEAGQRVSKAFRAQNRLPWEAIDKMRFDLAHDYPEVTAKEILAFAREIMVPTERRLRKPRFA
jgi:uncharacterized protein with HEPN domain